MPSVSRLPRFTRASISLVAASLAVAGCGDGSEGAGQPQGMPPMPVTIAVAELRPLEDATEYVATMKSLRSTLIQPQVEGQIVRIHVKSGDHVAAGAPLVQIDARRQQAAVSSQVADRAAKEADVTFARSQLQRANELLAAGAISRQEREQAETALRTAEAELKSLDAQVQERQVELRYFTVSAPTAGVVADVPVRVGNLVGPQTVLTSVEDNSRLEVHVQVPLDRAPEVKLGLPLQLVGPDSAIIASTTVSFISPRVDDQTQSVLVKGVVANRGGMRSDQFVRARLVWKSTQGLVIPVIAVSRVGGQHFAYVVEGKEGGLMARQRPVRLGPIVGDNYTVLAGIEPGDRIVVSGVQKLADGAPVAPQQ